MKNVQKTLFMFCLILAGLQTGSIRTEAAITTITEGTYTLRNVGTGKYLNVYANKDANNTNIDVYSKDNTVGQDFKIYKYGDSYALTPLSSSKGRVVNVYTSKTAKSGYNVCLWDRTDDSTQLWKFDQVSDGYVIRCANDTSCVLNATGSKDSSNVNILTYDSKNKNQIWVLEEPATVENANTTTDTNTSTNTTISINTGVDTTTDTVSDMEEDVEIEEDIEIEESQLTITGTAVPSTIYQGKAFSCKGTVTSNYNIIDVTGQIMKNDGKTVVYGKSVNPNTVSYNLYNGTIDKALLFNKLSKGNYYYRVTATDESGVSLVLVDKKFEVKQPATKTLSIDTKKISEVGWQKPNTLYCQAYSLAYCRTILDGKKHTYNQYWGNGGGQPDKAKYKHSYHKTAKQAFRAVYDQINAGKPCIIFGNQKGGGQHYITVYGYTGVKDSNNMTISNLKIIDSISRGGTHYLSGDGVKKSITSLSAYKSGKYDVLVAK